MAGPRHTPARTQVRALVVDDEPNIVALVTRLLEREGMDVTTAASGSEALDRARELQPDLVVLDLTLPHLDGIEVCRRLRAFSEAYVVMLTARDGEAHLVTGLSSGADDYVTKPFSPRELLARVRAGLRRPVASRRAVPVERDLGGLRVDPAARTVTVEDAPCALTPLELDLLLALSAQPGVVCARADLLERVWGPGWFGDDHLVDVHVGNLRRKLGDDSRRPRWIHTVRGVGYRLDADHSAGNSGDSGDSGVGQDVR
jgi:DNA-binding response OmpR family regulator